LYRLKLLGRNKKFWVSSFGCWGIVWSVAEGVLYSLQLSGIAPDATLGYGILLLFFGSFLGSGIMNWPLRTRSKTINETGVKIRIKFGDIWQENGEKIIAFTRCFSTKVDDIVIHSGTLHGMFVKRNFVSNDDAKSKIDSVLGENSSEVGGLYEPGKTIRVEGIKDTAFLVGLTTLDAANQASVTPNDYFIALANMWETIRTINSSEAIVCPLLGTGRSRLNFNNTAIFTEILNSALIAMKNGFITNELVFIIHPSDIENETVDIDELENTLNVLCEYENLHRMIFRGQAQEIPV